MSDTISFIKFTKTGDTGNSEGKNSNVFLAKDDQLGEELLIKKMEKINFKQEEYFLESKMLYASKHPNIAEIQYASQDEYNIYLAMPYYANGSLNSKAENEYLTVREIIRYSLDILSGLSYIHSKNLLHLDIKPTNILLDDTGKAVLTDFGLSRYMDENGIADQQTVYTHHIDPEWFNNSARTIQSDIYQVGLTMYRLCNGVDILGEQMAEMGIADDVTFRECVVRGKFPDRKRFLPHIPKKLQKIVLKALEIDPNSRYNNTIEMMNHLSVIDSNLDWIFTSNTDVPYSKVSDGYKYFVQIRTTSSSIECTRTNLNTNKTNRISKYCMKYDPTGDDLAKKISAIVGGLS